MLFFQLPKKYKWHKLKIDDIAKRFEDPNYGTLTSKTAAQSLVKIQFDILKDTLKNFPEISEGKGIIARELELDVFLYLLSTTTHNLDNYYNFTSDCLKRFVSTQKINNKATFADLFAPEIFASVLNHYELKEKAHCEVNSRVFPNVIETKIFYTPLTKAINSVYEALSFLQKMTPAKKEVNYSVEEKETIALCKNITDSIIIRRFVLLLLTQSLEGYKKLIGNKYEQLSDLLSKLEIPTTFTICFEREPLSFGSKLSNFIIKKHQGEEKSVSEFFNLFQTETANELSYLIEDYMTFFDMYMSASSFLREIFTKIVNKIYPDLDAFVEKDIDTALYLLYLLPYSFKDEVLSKPLDKFSKNEVYKKYIESNEVEYNLMRKVLFVDSGILTTSELDILNEICHKQFSVY